MKSFSIISKIAVLAMLLVLVLGVSSFATTSNPRKINYKAYKGDVNLDGKLTKEDSNMVLRFSAKLGYLSGEQQYIADMDNDGEITAADARKVLRIVNKLDKKTTITISYVPGDIDGNGKLEAADARVLMNSFSGSVKLTRKQKMVADVDCDGKVTAADARLISRRSAILCDLPIEGDVNGDGKLYTNDGDLIVRELYGYAPLEGAQRFIADLNRDGKLDTRDYNILLKRVRGLE